jgi:hypothetical protein
MNIRYITNKKNLNKEPASIGMICVEDFLDYLLAENLITEKQRNTFRWNIRQKTLEALVKSHKRGIILDYPLITIDPETSFIKWTNLITQVSYLYSKKPKLRQSLTFRNLIKIIEHGFPLLSDQKFNPFVEVKIEIKF